MKSITKKCMVLGALIGAGIWTLLLLALIVQNNFEMVSSMNLVGKNILFALGYYGLGLSDKTGASIVYLSNFAIYAVIGAILGFLVSLIFKKKIISLESVEGSRMLVKKY